MEVADGEDERAEPGSEDDPKRRAKPVPAPGAALHRPAPQHPRQERIGLGEGFEFPLNAAGKREKNERGGKEKWEPGRKKFLGAEEENREGGGRKTVIEKAPPIKERRREEQRGHDRGANAARPQAGDN